MSEPTMPVFNSLHLVFSSETLRCKAFDAHGTLLFECEMHDAAVNGPGFGFRGRCPRGCYPLGTPVPKNDPGFGYWFIPVLDVPNREGIGIHSGGSDLAHPFAPHQGWEVTLGCLRVQGADLDKLVDLVHGYPGNAKITVSGP